MCQEGFLNKSEIEAWDFLEELAEKTLQWEITKHESLRARINIQRGEIHAVANTTYIDSRFATLENMLKSFVLSQAPANYSLSQMVSCSQCQSTDHSLSAYPLCAQQLTTS